MSHAGGGAGGAEEMVAGESSTGIETIDPKVAALAERLGLSASRESAGAEELEAAGALLDDEFERLDVRARELLRERLNDASEAASCPSCATLFLPRYRPDDARCRVCAAPLGDAGGDDTSDIGATDWGFRATVTAEPPAEAAWSIAPELSLGRRIVLDPENVDWDEQADDLARQEAERREAEARRKAEEEARRREEEARRKAEEEARRREEEERRRRAEEKRKAEEEARRRAEEEKRKAEEEARRQAEEEARRKAEEARRQAEEARRQAEEEKRRAEEEARRQAEEEARRQAEEEAIAKAQARPALGAIWGPRAGELLRLDDLPAEGVSLSEGDPSVVHVVGEEQARLFVAPGGVERVNGKKMGGQQVDLKLGDMISLGETAWVLDATGELEGASGVDMHFARNDDKPGGPWPYWNREVTVGAAPEADIRLVDDGVDDHHAKVATHFGRVVLSDTSTDEDGLWVKGRRMRWLILKPKLVFKVGKEGPELVVKPGQAQIKAKSKAARAMKPTRHNRTVLELRDADNNVLNKVFLFTRREIRFGRVFVDDDGRKLNELILTPAEAEAANVSPKQGGIVLSRGGAEIQRWRTGDCDMLYNDEPLAKGESAALKRRFTFQLGEGMLFEGRVFRSPTEVADEGPPRLGMNGGHPFECVRLDRIYTNHVYVFLVRMLRIGRSKHAPLRIDDPSLEPDHCQVQLRQGKYQILAPGGDVTLELSDGSTVDLEPGVPAALQLNTKVHLGGYMLVFRICTEHDFDF